MYHKAKDYFKQQLYSWFNIKLPKIKDQREYWENRGNNYMEDFFTHGFAERELFFQDMIIDALRDLDFNSVFEAGCGFGWNIRRCKEEFPDKFVGGLDFSWSHLSRKASQYLDGTGIPLVNGDNCCMPLGENAFDVGFSLGVFMNIHPDRIQAALREMVRVCAKYIIHVEWNQEKATEDLRKRRAFKTNIISHDYAALYRSLGQDVIQETSYEDFLGSYEQFVQTVQKDDTWWAGYEGADKYVFYLIRVQK